ncbi:amino acid ABC transporter membrane protein 2 (PAAT family) [Hoeflea marina]|uniref:Amino acid ABC transporter membrane protein 2 (PAAT family) n=1 Tax=Hoeflea marina TaxID=274592 RepID=A0A317PSQ8_9HYPH|nr:ABC transporter permease [Hoeflea marina]PWW04503.1 amino acid ABC transporter membrane protein 2 (PAAT family) [Hoeflea marina]
MSYSHELIAPSPPPKALLVSWNRASIVGTILMGVWILGGILLVTFLFDAWDIDKIRLYGPKYISGLGVTLSLVAISISIGAALSLPIAYGRMSKNRVISWLAYGYVYFFRGTPLIAQLFLIYYGFGTFRPQLEAIGLWGVFRDAWNCALFAFTLNTAAYQAEILRGAVESVPKGQHEGAAALGLSKFQTFRKIILPQAMIVALRPYGNEIILMIKGSAIVAIVTVFDLMGETRRAFSRTFDFQTYVWAAIFYLAIVELLRNVWAVLEDRLTRHLKR